MSTSTPPIEFARIAWDSDDQPLSVAFGDVYFSKANGLAETRHVFLQHNQLPERFSALADGVHFTIAETGFGSGLNFLATWALWESTAPQTAQLQFVSVEKYPLKQADLRRALSLWPELATYVDALVEAYPPMAGTGFHRLRFAQGRVCLTLIIDEATQGFTQLLATTHPVFAHTGVKVDAWFLDGFAPSKNPQMWSDGLFSCIQKLSKPTTTAATFSAAAIVKNGLINAGFTVEKVAGFGRKREMVKARFTAQPPVADASLFINRHSFSPYPVPWTLNGNKPALTEKRVFIIGAGLAGCHTARALAERGWSVTLLERHSALAQEASGNPQGVLYAKLSHMAETQAEFNLSSLQYALQAYRPLWPQIGEQCGVLQLAHKPAEEKLQQALREKFSGCDDLVRFVDSSEASRLAGTPLLQNGIFFPHAGWINPRRLCDYLVDHPRINLKYHVAVTSLRPQESGWELVTHNGDVYQAPVVILCNATDALAFDYANHLPIHAIRGQVTYLPQHDFPPISTVVCAEGYIGPSQDNLLCTGATFNLKDNEPAARAEDHQTNLNNLAAYLPAFQPALTSLSNAGCHSLEGRVGFRCTLPDYLPAVGPLPHVDAMVSTFAPLRKNAKAGVPLAGTYWPGLYLNIGHGARGLAYTPLCAEILAAHINDEPLPVPQTLANALNPARFVIRDLIRNKR